jgi:uncharacterized membrane protein (DUF485 family)
MQHHLAAPAASGMASAADRPSTLAPPINEALFQALVRRRRTFAWTLTIMMLVIYFGFILTLAFSPQLLGQHIVQGQPTTWGIPIGFGMFVVTFALVAVYVHEANSVHDVMIAELRAGGTQ